MKNYWEDVEKEFDGKIWLAESLGGFMYNRPDIHRHNFSIIKQFIIDKCKSEILEYDKKIIQMQGGMERYMPYERMRAKEERGI